MKLSTAIISTLLAGVALAAPNNADLVKNDINDLSGYLKQLSGDTAQFNNTVDGIAFALQIQVDAVNIDKVLLKAKTDCDQSSTFPGNDSLSISAQLLGVANTVKKSLAAVQAKAAAFDELKPIVLNSLYALKTDTDAFAKSLTAKLQPLEKAVAPAVTKSIDQEFNDAIVAYGGRAV